jgi:glycosyltransferase involved in cell wall biosynthesis
MRILHVSTHDRKGGAAIAAYRLHQGLLGCGQNSQMFVYFRRQNDKTIRSVYEVPGKTAQQSVRLSMWLNRRIKLHLRSQSVWSANLIPSYVARQINELNPDIVHLHWVADGFLPISALSHIKAPIVWTLHDMWPFTGGCHYTGDCTRFQEACGRCPQLHSQREHDVSQRILLQKHRHWQDLALNLIAPSQWMADEIRQSRVLSSKHIHIIPNGIDTTQYKPIDQQATRALLNLPQDKRLVLFGAVNSTSDPRKGFRHLREAMQFLSGELSNVCVMIFGASCTETDAQFEQPAYYLGQLHDYQSLVAVYSAADTYVAPSIQENLSNTVVEALACGTPTVAFDIGGMPSLIAHRRNGYLATPFDPRDLAQGIRWALENPDAGQVARATAESRYEVSVVAEQHIALYEALLSSSGGSIRQ